MAFVVYLTKIVEIITDIMYNQQRFEKCHILFNYKAKNIIKHHSKKYSFQFTKIHHYV